MGYTINDLLEVIFSGVRQGDEPLFYTEVDLYDELNEECNNVLSSEEYAKFLEMDRNELTARMSMCRISKRGKLKSFHFSKCKYSNFYGLNKNICDSKIITVVSDSLDVRTSHVEFVTGLQNQLDMYSIDPFRCYDILQGSDVELLRNISDAVLKPFVTLYRTITEFPDRKHALLNQYAVNYKDHGYLSESPIFAKAMDLVVKGEVDDKVISAVMSGIKVVDMQRDATCRKAEAKELLVELGLTGKIRRRCATLEDLDTLWKPTPDSPIYTASVYTRGPGVNCTLNQFMDIIGTFKEIKFYVTEVDNYCGLVTTLEDTAAKLFAYDSNLKCYLFRNPSEARYWSLTPGTLVKVTSISPYPSLLTSLLANVPIFVLTLEGCHNSMLRDAGLSIMPTELKPVRNELTQYTIGDKIDYSQVAVNGVVMSHNSLHGVMKFECLSTDGITHNYIVDTKLK